MAKHNQLKLIDKTFEVNGLHTLSSVASPAASKPRVHQEGTACIRPRGLSSLYVVHMAPRKSCDPPGEVGKESRDPVLHSAGAG